MPVHPKDKLLPAGKLAYLLEHPIFGALGPELVDRLGPHAIPKSVPQGTVIFSKGDIGTNLFVVRSGTVRISSPSGQDKSAVLNQIHAGEIFGEIALLDGGERTADAIAVTDCDFIIIDRRNFLPLVRSQPDAALKLIELLCSRLRRTSEQVENVLFMDLPSRLARTLLRLVKAGETKDQHPPLISITQLELSQIIGMSRESTNKQLREWEKLGWLHLGRGAIHLLAEKMILRVAGEVDPSASIIRRSKK